MTPLPGSGRLSAEVAERDLTKNERSLVEIVADPGQWQKNAATVADLLGIDPRDVRRMLARPAVAQALRQAMTDWLFRHAPPILQALIDSCLIPGRDGNHDRRLFFSMVGLHDPTRRVEVTATNTVKHELGDKMAKAMGRRDEMMRQLAALADNGKPPFDLDAEADEAELGTKSGTAALPAPKRLFDQEDAG